MPDLIIIGGCNGAGKSTFASSFLPHLTLLAGAHLLRSEVISLENGTKISINLPACLIL
jgi:predicted ABC-type ATPase